MARRNNTVPQGVAGTGSAYILPESNALKGLLDNIDYNQKMGLLNVKSRNDYNTQLNKDFADNQLKAKSGILYQNELNSATQQWMDKGAQYRAQGFNPFNPNANDPNQIKASEDFLREKAQIEGMAETRDQYQKNFLDQQNAYEKGEADSDSWTALNDFYTKNSLADLYKGGIVPPTLTKAFDAAAFMKGIESPTIKKNTIKDNLETTTVAPNEGAIRLNIEGSLAQNKQAQRFFNKQFNIDPANIPAKTILGSVDPKEVATYMDQYYKTTPEGVAEAAKMFSSGEVPSYNSPTYQQFIADKTARQLQAESRYEKGIQNLVKQKAGEVNLENTKKYNFDLENQGMKREDQSMQRTRFGWDAVNQADKIEDRGFKNAETNKRDQFIQGLQVGNNEQVMALRQLAKAKNGSVGFDRDGSIKVSWITKSGENNVKHEQKINLNENNGDGYVQLNEVLSQLTGKKVDIEKLQSKPEYKGGLVDAGETSFTKPQIEQLRSKFKGDYKGLGKMLLDNGIYKSYAEAFKGAAEILDKKGRVHKQEFINTTKKNE